MTNEEAKRLYMEALEFIGQKDYWGALSLLDELDTERPNSRHVNYHRALCFLELGRTDEAEACYQRLVGRMDESQLQKLADAIKVTKAPGRTSLSSAGLSGLSGSNSHLSSMDDDVTQPPNIFVVQSSYPISVDECSVIGYVKKGVFHVGDVASLISSSGDTMPAPIARIGPAETPLNLAREGQRVVMSLRVDPAIVDIGSSLYSEERPSGSAKTKMASSNIQQEGITIERPSELHSIERLLREKTYDKAEAKLIEFVDLNPECLAAKRLLAQLYLDADPPLCDPAKALEIIRDVYETGGAEDPAVIYTLAQALACNDDPAMGLRYLERLHEATQSIDARQALAQRIHSFRSKYGLGDVWEFGDAYGEVLFESSEPAEIYRALVKGGISLDSQCRRNHVGNWGPIHGELAAVYPDVAALFKTEKPKSNTAFIITLIILCLGIVIAIFLPEIIEFFRGPLE